MKVRPVVVPTTSNSGNDLMNAYKNYVNCYINKPIDLDGFTAVIKSIEVFCLNTVKLPAN
jgi:two-component system, chemotaxis family, response regulator Rcp1